jgi:Ca-activated chloride channel family protein
MSALTVAAAGVLYVGSPESQAASGTPGKVTQGMLFRVDPRGEIAGECPLKHTDVKAEITGFLARVTVTQDFENTAPDKVEAVYTFPLPQRAAVDDMTMIVGERTIRGTIKRREEAREIYEQAKARGHVASLLDQERPNIFTQHVANIAPGAKVRIQISYVETLEFEEGTYEFSFPMVVGPRYMPRHGVPDAKRIAPPVTPEFTRAGHDLSLEVKLDAGLPIDRLDSVTHEITTDRPSQSSAVLRLKKKSVIPNKDFVVKYDVSGGKIRDAVLTHRGSKGGFFTLILQPPDRVTVEDVTPKELVFVLDTSGSMTGFPIEKAKETMRLAIDGLYPRDTFNLITFSGDTHVLFPEPVPATKENVAKAQHFLASRTGRGGTEMMKAIRAALDPSDSQDHLRIVCFMTDGYVGNDMEIIGEIKKHSNARIFSFGIGNSVNRFLLDNMAREGRGEVEYVNLNDDGSAAARRMHERMRNPLLTDVTVEFAGVQVNEVYPQRIPDLFSAKPVIVTGRYDSPGKGAIRLSGKMSGKAFSREIPVDLPAAEPRHDVLATLWARQKIGAVMAQDMGGLQHGQMRADLKEKIIQLGLEFRLMTQFTSFVAVEVTVVTEGGKPRRVEVPVEMPEGVSYEGIYGGGREMARMKMGPVRTFNLSATASGVVGGIIGGGPAGAPPPPMMSEPVRREAADASAQSGPKLAPALEAMVQRHAQGALTPADMRIVQAGRVRVQVWLAEGTAAELAKLKALGFQQGGETRVAKIVTGWIALDKLEALSKLDVVRYVGQA